MLRSYSVDFEPGYEREFVFDFVLDGRADLYIEGDLSEFVKLDKEKIFGRKKIDYFFTFIFALSLFINILEKTFI